MNNNFWLVTGAIVSGLAVALGAFGSHGLEDMVTEARLETFETAVKYQMYHGLALLAVHLLRDNLSESLVNYIGFGFLLGVIFFSGSLYLLVLTDTSWFGAITPIGGVLFLVSWGLLAYGGIKQSV